jgi:hypothetical protein
METDIDILVDPVEGIKRTNHDTICRVEGRGGLRRGTYYSSLPINAAGILVSHILNFDQLPVVFGVLLVFLSTSFFILIKQYYDIDIIQVAK